MTTSKIKGFTLVELMIVISIIVILTGIMVTALSPSKEKARDSKRVSDIAQLQLVLEQYFDRCQRYPAALTLDNAEGCPSGVKVSTYISVIPKTPEGGDYSYTIDGSGTNYVLRADLKHNHEAFNDSLSGTILGVDCDKNSLNYCVGP